MPCKGNALIYNFVNMVNTYLTILYIIEIVCNFVANYKLKPH